MNLFVLLHGSLCVKHPIADFPLTCFNVFMSEWSELDFLLEATFYYSLVGVSSL